MSSNATLTGGYTRLDSQAETTGKGPFDLRTMMIRKQRIQRNEHVNDSYPNADDQNLGCVPGDILVYRRGLRNTTRSGAHTVAVFSSLNGEWYGRYASKDGWKRDHAIAGVCKTLYNLPGAASTATARGSDYQTDSGIAFLESGSISASRNTGSETINAGDLVILDLPPTNLQLTGSGSMFMSPNNPNGGMPIGKYVMVTRPYHAEDQVGHLCTISALLRRSRTQQVQPGILGYSFNEIHYQHESGRPGNSILSDASLETAWTFQYAWGLWFAMFEEMLANDVIKSIVERAANAANNTDAKRHAACVELFETLMVTRLDESTATTNPSFKIFDYVMQHHNARTNHRKKAMQDFERRNAAALDNKTKQVLRDDKDLNHHYAQLTRAPLQGLYAAFARSAAFNDAWIIGRAINTALPGETLDLLVACRTRPSNR